MKRLTSSILLISLLALHTVIIAQSGPGSFVINGRVTSFDESLPLEGAGVVVKGSSNVTGTQADGTFSLQVTQSDTVIVISLSGYESKEVKISAKNKQYDIVLKRSDHLVAVLGRKKGER